MYTVSFVYLSHFVVMKVVKSFFLNYRETYFSKVLQELFYAD